MRARGTFVEIVTMAELPFTSRLYLASIYIAAIPCTYICLRFLPGQFSLPWLLLTIPSAFIASVNLRLPKSATVIISMSDVFPILALIYFGTGPALVTLWVDTITASITDYSRRHGVYFYRKMLLHRFFFNLAGSPLAVLAMGLVYNAAMTSGLASPANLGLAMALVAVTWFTVNTVNCRSGIVLEQRVVLGHLEECGRPLSAELFWLCGICRNDLPLLSTAEYLHSAVCFAGGDPPVSALPLSRKSV